MSDEDPSLILETERLILRRLRAADVAFLTDLWTDPEVTRYLGGPRERVSLRSALEEEAAGPAEYYNLWPVIEKETGHGVGHCGLLAKEPENVASERDALKLGMRLEKEVERSGGALRKIYAIESTAE